MSLSPFIFDAPVWLKASEEVSDIGDKWNTGIRDKQEYVLNEQDNPAPTFPSLIDKRLLSARWKVELQWYELVGNLSMKFEIDSSKLKETGEAYLRSEQDAYDSVTFWDW